MHILHIESGQVECMGHFPVTIDSLLPDNGCPGSAFSASSRIDTQAFEGASEILEIEI